MPIFVKCRCGTKYKVSDRSAGKKIKCNKCQQPIKIPASVDDDETSAAPDSSSEAAECGKDTRQKEVEGAKPNAGPDKAQWLSVVCARMGLSWPGPILGILMLIILAWIVLAIAWLIQDPEWLFMVPDLLPMMFTAGLIGMTIIAVVVVIVRRSQGVSVIPWLILLISLIALIAFQSYPLILTDPNNRMLHGWVLAVDYSQGDKAQIVYPSRPRRPLGVYSIEIPSADKWKVLLVHSNFSISKGDEYELTLRVRAGAPRSIHYTVTQSQQPWDGLGIWGKAELTRDFQTITQSFKATQTEKDARLVLILGESTSWVEVLETHLTGPGGEELLQAAPRP